MSQVFAVTVITTGAFAEHPILGAGDCIVQFALCNGCIAQWRRVFRAAEHFIAVSGLFGAGGIIAVVWRRQQDGRSSGRLFGIGFRDCADFFPQK